MIGGTETLSATLSPDSAQDIVVWSSSDTSVATVDQNGKVTAKGPGSAVIRATAEAGKVSAACRVNVSATDLSVTFKGNIATVTYLAPTFSAGDVYIASYDRRGRLAGISMAPLANGKATASVLGRPGYTIKAFLFEKGTVNPLTEQMEYKVN